MITLDFADLLIVGVVAFVAPLLAGAVPRGLVPPVVVEVLLGIVVGPQGLAIVKPHGAVYLLYLMGLGFLLFLAGQDIDPGHFRDPVARVTGSAFLVSLVLSFPVAYLLTKVAPDTDLRLLALSLTASSLGILIPVVRDAGVIETDFGQLAVMAGSMGEFGALLLLTILFSADGKSTSEQTVFVVALVGAAVVVGVVIFALWRTGWMGRVLSALDDTTSQLRVRGALVMLLVFAGLSHRFGVDTLLGAFIAGVVLRLADRDERPNREVFKAKLDAIGFGFLIPVFFVVTGVQFDVRALLTHGSALELVPLIVIALVVVRAGPALLYRRRLGTRPAVAVGFLQAATLTFPVVVAEVGLTLHLLSRATAAALIGASLVSAVVFPAIALALRPWTAVEALATAPE
jgi:Kef-type K+ transport system membrane component KefB